ncbi:MAG: glycoside hydrolase family 78 protein [Clostridia bacterium]|nr:glycoside hydrolase family 78 protein [Clostridia bacterium]
MIYFNELKCNYENNPISVGQKAVLNWNYTNTYTRNVNQVGYQVIVSKNSEFTDLVFDSKCVKSADMSIDITEVINLDELTWYYWKVLSTFDNDTCAESKTALFRTGIFSLNSWNDKNCHWIAPRAKKENLPASLDFSKQIKIKKNLDVSYAFAYIFTSGFCTVTVNEKLVDDRLLAPANSNYDIRSYYETYDISDLLDNKNNTLTIRSGSGYNGDYSQYGYRYFGKIGIIALIEVIYSDGSKEYIPSNSSWECYDTPVVECSIYHGETYDATKSSFVKYPLINADNKAPYSPNGTLTPRSIPQIKIFNTDKPISMWDSAIPARQPDPDSNFPGSNPIPGFIYDFGEVSTGIVRIVLKANKGDTVSLFHTEMILEDGSPDRYTNRSAKATDKYICCGDGNEEFCPSFTYHCFRYVHISGINPSNVISIEKCSISSDFEITGYFDCSDAMINRFHKIMLVGIKNNMMSIPTDCAVRDERTPCAMDSQAIEKSVMFNYSSANYYTKWLDDVVDRYNLGDGSGNPDWNGDIVSLMWRIRSFYGDLTPTKKHFNEGVRLFLTDCDRTKNALWEKGYGDWCNPNQNNWQSFFGSVTAVNTALLYAMGVKLQILGAEINADVETLEKIKNNTAKIKDAFNKLCVKESGKILGGRHAEYAMPLYENIINEENYDKVLKKLINSLKKDKKNDIGIYGAMSLFEVLDKANEVELATSLLHNPEYPGYGFLLAKGATSLWEQWRYKGRMDSHSHGMFAGPDATFYQMYAGIRSTSPAFKTIKIEPKLPIGMTYAKASINTPVGKISAYTEYYSNGYQLSIEIPIGCKAHVVLPKEPLLNTEYVLFDGERKIDYSHEFDIGSGIYNFRLMPANLQIDH